MLRRDDDVGGVSGSETRDDIGIAAPGKRKAFGRRRVLISAGGGIIGIFFPRGGIGRNRTFRRRRTAFGRFNRLPAARKSGEGNQ